MNKPLQPERTHFAQLTPPGRAAVSTLILHGPDSADAVQTYFQAANGRTLLQQQIGNIVYGHWQLSAAQNFSATASQSVSETHAASAEDLVICRRDEQTIEIHSHADMPPQNESDNL